MWEYRYLSNFFGPFSFRTSYLFNLESSTAVLSLSIWRRFDEGRFMDDAPLFLETVDAISLKKKIDTYIQNNWLTQKKTASKQIEQTFMHLPSSSLER